MLTEEKVAAVLALMGEFSVLVGGEPMPDGAEKFCVLFDPDGFAETHVVPDGVRNFPRRLREVLTDEELEALYAEALNGGWL